MSDYTHQTATVSSELVLVGNVGKDAEPLRYTQSGKAVTSFSVAVAARKREDKPTWWKVTVWEKTAEIMAEHIKKGMTVLVRASNEFTVSVNPETLVAYFEATGQAIQFLSGKSDSAASSRSPISAGPAETDDDIPF